MLQLQSDTKDVHTVLESFRLTIMMSCALSQMHGQQEPLCAVSSVAS